MTLARYSVLAGACAVTLGIHGTTSPAPPHATDSLPPPSWAFPGNPLDPVLHDSAAPRTLPDTRVTYNLRELTDQFTAPDWYPASHPPMPGVVAQGRMPDLRACAYCHLPSGRGRPENAALAGLPAGYIEAQLTAMRAGLRRPQLPNYRPGLRMHQVATQATEAEIRTAAAYFASRPFRSGVEVREAVDVPSATEAGWLYHFAPGQGTQPLGTRILEGTTELERHELRDPRLTYIAYVPVGSLRRGEALANGTAAAPTPACVGCHGPQLWGNDSIPPLAGRFPTYLLRQLLAFSNGSRASPAAAPMQAVASTLSLEDMVAVAAYAASLRPQH